MKPVRLTRPKMTRGREYTLTEVNRFHKAQKELEKRCKELGIEVPVMVC